MFGPSRLVAPLALAKIILGNKQQTTAADLDDGDATLPPADGRKGLTCPSHSHGKTSNSNVRHLMSLLEREEISRKDGEEGRNQERTETSTADRQRQRRSPPPKLQISLLSSSGLFMQSTPPEESGGRMTEKLG
eukprot:scaffold301_cov243-Pinguiococcus_pyrenoidosus.AAC.74